MPVIRWRRAAFMLRMAVAADKRPRLGRAGEASTTDWALHGGRRQRPAEPAPLRKAPGGQGIFLPGSFKLSWVVRRKGRGPFHLLWCGWGTASLAWAASAGLA